jgi:hypothetical protein
MSKVVISVPLERVEKAILLLSLDTLLTSVYHKGF